VGCLCRGLGTYATRLSFTSQLRQVNGQKQPFLVGSRLQSDSLKKIDLVLIKKYFVGTSTLRQRYRLGLHWLKVLLFSAGCSQNSTALHAPSSKFMPPIVITSLMAGRVKYPLQNTFLLLLSFGNLFLHKMTLPSAFTNCEVKDKTCGWNFCFYHFEISTFTLL
jgi:hypothetical protein